jgi:hypothetical protein
MARYFEFLSQFYCFHLTHPRTSLEAILPHDSFKTCSNERYSEVRTGEHLFDAFPIHSSRPTEKADALPSLLLMFALGRYKKIRKDRGTRPKFQDTYHKKKFAI